MKRFFTLIITTLIITILPSLVGQALYAQSFNEQKFELSNGQKKMTVYPLPAAYNVNVYLSPALRDEADKVEVLDITGRKVLEMKVNKNVTEVNFNNLSNLANGVYMITAKDKNGKLLQSAKMIISK